MTRMNKELAKVAAVLYKLIDENREDNEMLHRLATITYYMFQHHDAWSEGEGAFFNLDEWISLLIEKNEGKNPYVVDMANEYGDGILGTFPEVAAALKKLKANG